MTKEQMLVVPLERTQVQLTRIRLSTPIIVLLVVNLLNTSETMECHSSRLLQHS
jgi:hypothetical protein